MHFSEIVQNVVHVDANSVRDVQFVREAEGGKLEHEVPVYNAPATVHQLPPTFSWIPSITNGRSDQTILIYNALVLQ